jgi:hypothetical protein
LGAALGDTISLRQGEMDEGRGQPRHPNMCGRFTQAYSWQEPEGTAACFFMVRNGVAVTPPVTSGFLKSVTRATLLYLLRDRLHLPVQERVIDRTVVYVAEAAFLCGSA